MTHLTLLLLVDAFRRDYLDRTTSIRQLASEGRVGALKEDFGFVPRAAYFGGLTPSEAGFTNMFCFDPAASPFGLARGVPSSARGRAVEEPLGLRTWVDAEARRRVTPYAASYLSSQEIPLDLLHNFDLVEKRAPWDRAVGHRTVFHELQDRGLRYFSLAWPETGRLGATPDRAIVAETLDAVTPPCRLAFVHLQELDAIGHAHGPESPELAAALRETDALVHTLVTGLAARVDRLDIVLWGDHGMVSVTGTADVWRALDQAGLRPGPDLVAFLDSTMARFWFPGANLESQVARALEGLPGRVLGPADLRRYGLDGCDRRNGELIFLADPGVLITPNFFQRRGTLLRGMHGYDPDCPDNQGLFLVRDGGPAGHIGVVGPTAVYEETQRLLGFAPDDGRSPLDGRSEDRPLLMESPTGWSGRSVDRPTDELFTQHPNADADVMVATHMSRIVEDVRALVPDAEAMLLTGSFGRGEGAVMCGEAGALVPVNDYDVLVIAKSAPDAQSGPLRQLGERLALEFGTDFVHLAFWPELGPALPMTLANYDIRYGSRVLMGDPDRLSALPQMAASEIPLFEAVQLVFNRLAGLLTGLGHAGAPRGPRAHRYLVNQTMKGLMALGDWRLLRAQAYDVSYRKRMERFTWLAAGMGVPANEADAICMAYQFKLYPESVPSGDVDALAQATARWLVDAAMRGMSELTARPITTPSDAAVAYYDLTTRDRRAIEADNAFSARTLADDAIVRVSGAPEASVRQTIYAAIPLIAAAWAGGDREGFTVATSRLSTCLTPPWPEDLTPANWEVVRGRLSHAWLSLVH